MFEGCFKGKGDLPPQTPILKLVGLFLRQIGPPPLFLVGVGKNFRDERDLPYMEEAILFPLKLVIWGGEGALYPLLGCLHI